MKLFVTKNRNYVEPKLTWRLAWHDFRNLRLLENSGARITAVQRRRS